MSPMFKKRKKHDTKHLRDSPFSQSDRVVLKHIMEVIEELQEYIEVPTLETYEIFLKGELEWIKSEKEIRRALKKISL